jgi:2'-5' RNA ligase
MRTFFAIEIPEEIRRSIHSAGLEMPGRLSRVSEDNMHITLQFLGDTSEEKLAKAERALNDLREGPFRATVKGISYFGGRDIHTVFADVMDDGRIKEIYLDIGKSLNESGIDFESGREYVPHATIARVKQGGAELREFISKNSERLFGEFEVRSVCIKKSVLTGEGPVYTTLCERKLG